MLVECMSSGGMFYRRVCPTVLDVLLEYMFYRRAYLTG